MDEQKLIQGIEAIGQITHNCGFIKLNSDETDIEYLRIDNQIFDKEAIENGTAMNFIRKLQRAKNIVRELKDMSKISDEVAEFIIKYHPTCIGVRDDLKINDEDPNEIPCYSHHLLQTYDEWIADEFKISGYLPTTTIKEPNVLLSYETFMSLLKVDKIQEELSFEANVCPLYAAYNSVLKVKKFFDNHPDYLKKLNSNVKQVSFITGKDRFPIIKLRTKNKCTYSYDFRNPEKRKECLQILRLTTFEKQKQETPQTTERNRPNVFKKNKTLTLKPIIPVPNKK